MTELIEWLRAQLDEDERLAQATPGGVYLGNWPTDAECDYALAFDPARMLAEVKAKRAVVQLHDGETGHCNECGSTEFGYQVASPCRTVKMLARPYAVRDGWRDEWSVG